MDGPVRTSLLTCGSHPGSPQGRANMGRTGAWGHLLLFDGLREGLVQHNVKQGCQAKSTCMADPSLGANRQNLRG